MPRAPGPQARLLPDAATAARAGAAEIAALLLRRAAAAPVVSLGLAGGHTPRRLYEALAATPGLPWERIHLFWGDERCVPPDDAASNYALAEAALLRRVPVPAAHVHRMPGEVTPPARAAAAYEATLRGFFRAPWPALDVVLLGVGRDGHTASLFPGHPALAERERWVAAVATQAASPPWRLTLTLPALRAARTVVVVATGADKAAVVAPILRGDPEAARLPAARVHGRERTLWIVDRAAAG